MKAGGRKGTAGDSLGSIRSSRQPSQYREVGESFAGAGFKSRYAQDHAHNEYSMSFSHEHIAVAAHIPLVEIT